MSFEVSPSTVLIKKGLILQAEVKDEVELEGFPSANPVHNLWSEDKNHAQLPDLIHDKPFVSDVFKQVRSLLLMVYET